MTVKSSIWNARTLITQSPTFAPFGSAALRTISWILRRNPLQTRTAKYRTAMYLNAGCGKSPTRDCVNLDYIWQPGVDLVWDLARRLPFAEGTLRGIYTEHTLEHLPLETVTGHLFPEFYRVLQPGGHLRIIVPDADLFIRLYEQARCNPNVVFPGAETDDECSQCLTPMMHVNRCFHSYGHLFGYDFATMQIFLQRTGFIEIEKSSFGKGREPKLILDTPQRAPGSLYIEATKPS